MCWLYDILAPQYITSTSSYYNVFFHHAQCLSIYWVHVVNFSKSTIKSICCTSLNMRFCFWNWQLRTESSLWMSSINAVTSAILYQLKYLKRPLAIGFLSSANFKSVASTDAYEWQTASNAFRSPCLLIECIYLMLSSGSCSIACIFFRVRGLILDAFIKW